MPTRPDRLLPGSPYPLGATTDGVGTNFAVFSAHATRIELCLFDPSGRREVARYDLPECTDQVWHGYLPHVRAGQLYGFRAHGPYRPEEGHRFNHNKLLLDPYARLLHGQVRWSDSLYGYRINAPKADLSFDRRDSAAAMPKSVVVDDSFHWRRERRPEVPWPRTVIYEAHVKGLTQRLEHILPPERGTFSALSDPRLIDHLVKLGVTALELLPIHAFVQDRYLVEKKLANYWGYNTLAFFAPEPRYLGEGGLNSIRAAVQSLHAAGIEVILDVVYNHTAEGSELGPTFSFRGLDNASYYRLLPDNPRHHINDTGTGNTVNTSHPRVIQLIMDSLRYWVEAFHVDGFRFDLGVTLGREPHGFDPNNGLFKAMRQDPVLANVKLISEPWDVGPGGYQIGNHPPGFAEWNGRFRDHVRRFWKGDGGMRPALAAALGGTAELFDKECRRPWASVNFVTAHDGYTLADWTAYEQKHNEANGEDNQDGANDNESRNWGVEGPTEDEAILAQRARVARAALATLAFSHGTPMLLGGDEFGRTQQGNNNAYCQDNELSWFDWGQAASDPGRAMTGYVARLLRLRAELGTISAACFMHGVDEPLPGVADTAWFDETGAPMGEDDWNYTEGRLLALRRAARRDDGRIEITLLLVNGSHEPRRFELPPPTFSWTCRLDSAAPEAPEHHLDDAGLDVQAHSVVLLSTYAEDHRT
ncbi:glycogen debranching protein GlgX [Coralloluteibacterium thermophilus]|uniref:Glycogen debranching protein GlgX n=1 Tax=Coralloluteibacterium thermophilum TaxID=2707049 RepID=A0ABV9NII5_9GAMM